MCYFQMLGRPPEWVHAVAVDYFRHTGKAPLVSVQASGSSRKEPVAGEAFHRHLQAALKAPSLGVNVFSWDGLKNDAEKLEILREALASPAAERSAGKSR
jgi:hypothetical protein